MKVDDIIKHAVDGAMGLTDKISVPMANILKAVADRKDMKFVIPYKRRGDFFEMGQITPAGDSSDKRKTRRERVLPLKTIKRLSNTDPITFSIKQTRKSQIAQTKWAITRDTEGIEAELDQWQNMLKSQLNIWKLEGFTPYEPDKVPKDVFRELDHQVKGIIGGKSPLSEQRAQLRWLFENAISKIRYDADKKASSIEIFKRPNREHPSWDQFIPIVVDDILMFDLGNIIKNKCPDGSIPIAEFYTRPGQEIFLWREEDGSVPEPPNVAYSWEQEGKKLAEFDDNEIIVITSNPQQDHYGMSPVEVMSYIITTTLYIDTYNIDFFKFSNVPPGVLNLGEGVTPADRTRFRLAWQQEIQRSGGLHRMMFMSGSKGVDYIPLRAYSSKDMQMIEYLKWSLAIKSACFQISPQDIGFTSDLHRTTAQVQYEISKDRGLRTLLALIESHINEEIIKRDYGGENIKFEYMTDAPTDKVREAEVDSRDRQDGIISRNDRRKKIGKRPMEGGDVIMVDSPTGLVPVEMLDDIAEKMLLEGENTTSPEGENAEPQQPRQGVQGAVGSPTVPRPAASVKGAGPRPAAPKSSPPIVRVVGEADDLLKALGDATSNLRKDKKDVQFIVDYRGVRKLEKDEFNFELKKNLGFGVDNINYGGPLIENKDLIKQYEAELSREGYTPTRETIVEAMKGDIIRQAGGDPATMSRAMDDALSGDRYKMKTAIPTLLGLMLAATAAAGFSSSVRGLFSSVGKYGKKKVVSSLGRSRSMLKPPPRIIRRVK